MPDTTTWTNFEDMIHHPPTFKEYQTVSAALHDMEPPAPACLVHQSATEAPENLADAFALIERWDLRVDKVVLPEGHDLPTTFDCVTDGVVWGAQVVSHHLVKPGEVWFLPEDEFLPSGRVACLKG